jgi:glucan 1,3-beta-glucosidase
VPIESYSVGGWLRSFVLVAIAALAPIVCAAACATGHALPPFAFLLGRRNETRDALGVALAGIFMVLTLLSLQEALGLVFDPRYRDFTFAPLGAAAFAFLMLTFTAPASGPRAAAETVAAAALAGSAIYIMPNETFANWQAIWFCVAILCVAVTLVRVRDAPG